MSHYFQSHALDTAGKMIRVTRYYRWQEGASFDREYYNKQHMELTRDQLLPHGLMRLESDRMLSSRSPVPGEIIAESHAYFKSLEQAQAAMTAVSQILLGNASKYTNLQPEIRLSTVTAHI